MNRLVRTYGATLSSLLVGLTALWIVGLVILPQLNMLQRAFDYEARDGAAQQAGVDLERAYQRIATLDFDIAQARRDAERATAAPAAPSPSDPFAGIGRASPRAATPGPTPPGVVVPGVPSVARTPDATPQQRLAQLQEERARLEAPIPQLKDRFDRLTVEQRAQSGYSVRNFTTMSPLHWRIFGLTIFYAVCCTVLAFVICYPIAYAMAQSTNSERVALMMLGLVIPYAINELLRIFAWTMILANEGIVNTLLNAVGFIDLDAGGAIRWLASNGAVFWVMVYTYLLFMVFPVYNAIETLDRNQIEAARDLGASTVKIHSRVVLPHAKPGIAVGSIMIFMLSAGSISVPGLVGPGLHPDWFSQIIYRNFFEAGNWNIGSARALLLLAACTIFILVVMRLFQVSIREIAR